MLPESLRRVWDTLDDDERARLNLIIMNYFDPYQPRAESPMDESDQLEAIVDDFMVERMGGKGAFIHNYKIDPAEIGQVNHDKKYFSPAGEHQYIRYNDILYHPDDRKDLEMKYASADTAFDTAWSLLKDLSLREHYDISDGGLPTVDMRLFSDRGGELPEGQTEDITDEFAWSDLSQEDMDELNPVMRLFYDLKREAYNKGYGHDNYYNPHEEPYEDPENDILNFIDKLEFWSGERDFKTPFGPHSHQPEKEAQDMLRRWREGVAAHAKRYGGS
jgi:hypothetical protein